MDDIAGLKWTSTPANGQPRPTSKYTAFSTSKPTPPNSGRATPLDASSAQPQSKSTTPLGDSFANLVSFGPGANKNLSLLEQQKRQTEARLQQQQKTAQSINDQYAGGDDQFWNNLGSGRGTPAMDGVNNVSRDAQNRTPNNNNDDEDDLFAAFNKPAPRQSRPATTSPNDNMANNEEDDPFELLNSAPHRTDTAPTDTSADDDDVLGLLGESASAHPRTKQPSLEGKSRGQDLHPQDKAIAELVDMGFPTEKARRALEATETGTDVQAAVGYLLNQAHAEARQKSLGRDSPQPAQDRESRLRNGHPGSGASRSRTRCDVGVASRSRQQGQSGTAEKDFEQMAAEFGSNFLKTAGSFWKQSTKRVQQAVQDFNADGESSSQPRWMREVERPQRIDHHEHSREDGNRMTVPTRRGSGGQKSSKPTDEALMLESDRPTPPPRPTVSSRPDNRLDTSAGSSRDHSPAIPHRLRESIPQKQPAFLRQQTPSPAATSRAALNRTAADDEAAQAYVSSARRRKPPANSQPVVSASEPDLLDGNFKDAARSQQGSRAAATAMPPSRSQSQPYRHTDIPVRPPPPTRTIPTVTAISLQASHSHREKGNEHFKRGDYSSAHTSYTTSISHLPDTHPLLIVLLTNRALTALKIGEPKTAISDADRAMTVIGISKGENETINMATGNGQDNKPMRDYYGKALMRKAEALEQMEKWTDAALVWREAVEGGHGGATSIQGRMRAEKAARPQPSKPQPKPKPASRPRPMPAKAASAPPAAAVNRLRAANMAAEKADDEKFRLSDSVDARIQAWKGGKADNLRALLGSLENVLWEGSGWKKISMADLVLPGKVKIQYMKGIAKVHPDKIPTDATTEQRMIAGAVFSALNEAWDKFKTENGL
ncbi:auxilin-like clathrin-binding protein required for normal clathrin function [Knufia peltigerae]|uniref:Auxilin-like clathrin-binding protein required for normal clathrin function n=1 Tax=Knufia peltigerae TaxID=1002370 RepID=A0AA38XYX3_9EURO|nr:auxilin-like clathrin-binding protein required for normal clathrin function [Knufia peltigerae]